MQKTELLMTESREQQKIKTEAQIENLALQSGLAIIVLKDESSNAAVKSNNNSICELLYSSAEFAPQCAKFCGAAYQNAIQAGEKITVKCHAGLHYDAVPLALDKAKPLVAIVGRTFLKSEEYKNAVERAMNGDWKQFSADEMFKNVHLASSSGEIDRTTKKLAKTVKKEREYFAGMTAVSQPENEEIVPETLRSEDIQSDELSKMIAAFHKDTPPKAVVVEKPVEENTEEAEESAAWRSVFGSLLELEYKNAYPAVLNFLASRHSLSNLAWLENANERLQPIAARGELAGQPFEIAISADDIRLQDAIEKETSLELRERAENQNSQPKMINLFPVAVGGKIISALLVGDNLADVETKRHIAQFVQNVAAELEILRLREQVERQSRTAKAIRRLNENLKEIDEEQFWISAAQISAELMRAERGSLLVLNEDGEEFTVKAVVGSRADVIKHENPLEIGKKVAQKVLRSGKPLIVRDINKEGIAPAPAEWKYKTDSFISYPIMIGGRKIGVLNVTDTIDGEIYNESDLELLNTISPQLAIALDRTSLKRQTVELRQISITDPLTGLLNRRYLEERLAEEINRSQRHAYQMSFMMIDVDEFKSYNDNFSHLEGDKALQIVGQCLKATLRGADVAARYGGEEFSILLPQTNVNEAYVIAERLRQNVETTEFPNRKVTISIGIATCTAEMCSAKDLMAAADKALYQAKGKGRNTVQIFRESLPAGELPAH